MMQKMTIELIVRDKTAIMLCQKKKKITGGEICWKDFQPGEVMQHVHLPAKLNLWVWKEMHGHEDWVWCACR